MREQETPRVVKMPAKHDVYVGRPSKWGNPFHMVYSERNSPAERLRVVSRYRKWLPTQPKLMAALPELRGKVLACWCAPLPCHADVLAELANGPREQDREATGRSSGTFGQSGLNDLPRPVGRRLESGASPLGTAKEESVDR